MKNIILIAIILCVGWYGNYLYKQRHEEASIKQSSTDSSYRKNTKCITKDGKTFYGDIPKGTVCVQEKPVEGALAVMPSQYSDKAGNYNFKCDGRTHCSQMTSCEEATFFLSNCPNVKMDGNNDGVPCERQWCK